METMKTSTIKKQVNKPIDKKEDVDWEFVESIKRSLEDVKAGRIRRVR